MDQLGIRPLDDLPADERWQAAELALAPLPEVPACAWRCHDKPDALGCRAFGEHVACFRRRHDDDIEPGGVHGLEVLGAHDIINANREDLPLVDPQAVPGIVHDLIVERLDPPQGQGRRGHALGADPGLQLHLVLADEHALGREQKLEGAILNSRDAFSLGRLSARAQQAG